MKKISATTCLALILLSSLHARPWTPWDKAQLHCMGIDSCFLNGRIDFQIIPLKYLKRINDTLYRVSHARFDNAFRFVPAEDTLADPNKTVMAARPTSPDRQVVAIIAYDYSANTVRLVTLRERPRKRKCYKSHLVQVAFLQQLLLSVFRIIVAEVLVGLSCGNAAA